MNWFLQLLQAVSLFMTGIGLCLWMFLLYEHWRTTSRNNKP